MHYRSRLLSWEVAAGLKVSVDRERFGGYYYTHLRYPPSTEEIKESVQYQLENSRGMGRRPTALHADFLDSFRIFEKLLKQYQRYDPVGQAGNVLKLLVDGRNREQKQYATYPPSTCLMVLNTNLYALKTGR